MAEKLGASRIFGSAGANKGDPIKKCPGVKVTGSFGFVVIEETGRESPTSILDKSVANSSNVNLRSPAAFLKCFLKLFTPASYRPSM